MDDNQASENQKKSLLDSEESYEELKKLISDAAKLDEEDEKKLREIDNLSIGENEKIDWNSFSIMAMRGLLHGYENGELSFEKMMKIAWNCSLPLRSSKVGFNTMGAIASIAIKRKPKERNAKKPPFPTWIKKAAIEYAMLLVENHPNLKLSPTAKVEQSVLSLTLKQLSLFDLNIGEGGNRLTEKTIYQWICEHKHENNIPLQNTGPKRQ